jgi:1-acyl-sn-glycerol-3-phosphate acyltransferase
VILDALLSNTRLRRLGLVMKSTMQLDPVADVCFHRLPAVFVGAGEATGQSARDAIARLARETGPGEAVIMFPEGGNFTPQRRRRAIRHLLRRRKRAYARRAAGLEHVLPPRVEGVLSVLDTQPFDVLIVAHTGFGEIHSVADAWKALGSHTSVQFRSWRFDADDIPAGEDARAAWLFDRWKAVDEWVGSASAPATPPERSESDVESDRAALER